MEKIEENIPKTKKTSNHSLSKGGFGKVWKVQYKKTKEVFALKEMSKLKVIDKKSEKSINSEREFLSKLNHPFIVNMHYAFQDNDNLYLVMDMLSGGDLRYHISRHRRFSEEQTRFFIGGMILALEYIHKNNVIHRDIKPENLVLDQNGYVRITDFGIAKENMPDNSSETSGTPGYMSPEVMRSLNHSFPVDFFAIGVIGYEFMNGRRPYVGKNRREIKEQIASKQAQIKKEEIVNGWSQESADFINNLLIRKPEHRLGFKTGANELKEHPWMKYYPWEDLDDKKLPSPFIPEKKDNFDKRYCESVDRIGEDTKIRYEEILYDDEYQFVFVHFQYNKEEDFNRCNNNKNILNKDYNNSNKNTLIKDNSKTGSKEDTIKNNKGNNNNCVNNNNQNNKEENLQSTFVNQNKPNQNNILLINQKSPKIPITSNCNNFNSLVPSSYRNKDLCSYNNNLQKGIANTNKNNNNNANNKKEHHRQLSHSYSTKDVKIFQNKIVQNKNVLNNFISIDNNKEHINDNNNKAVISNQIIKDKKLNLHSQRQINPNHHYSNNQNQNLLNLLFFNKNTNNSVSNNNNQLKNNIKQKSHVRSSSMINNSNKKKQEYLTKINNKNKPPKKKLNRAESASILFNKSVSQYLLNKIKTSKTNDTNNNNNKKTGTEYEKLMFNSIKY